MDDGLGPSTTSVSFSWGPQRVAAQSFGQNIALDRKVWETAQNSATTLVLYAKHNPGVQKLVSGYEEWESNLREEAKQRLGGFHPLQQAVDNGLGAEDWDLLRRVKSAKPRFSQSLKRSASDNSLICRDLSASGGAPRGSKALRQQQQQRGVVRLASEWDLLTAFNKTFNDGFQAPCTLRPGPGLAASRASSPSSPGSGALPELAPMDFSVEAAKNLEAAASSFLESSRLVIQTAQQTLQETASNCHANFQTLGALLQHRIPGSQLAQSQSLARQIVPWAINAATSPSGPDLMPPPWGVPRPLLAPPGSPGAGPDASASGMAASADQEVKDNLSLMHQLQDYIQALETRPLVRTASLPAVARSIKDPGRQVAIVTTASLPWMTGTAVNPLLRAAYLAGEGNRKVTLMLPWLSKPDQQIVFPNSMMFESPDDQEAFVREWAQKRTGLACDFKVTFYPGRYAPEKGSILPVGDITQYIPDSEADVAVLEEPEHLNWYHHGTRWTDKFNHVVGVMHTNYLDYARREEGGNVKEALLRHINAWVCRVHCHKVIKLSDAVQDLPRQETMFVHGVSPAFLQVGERKAAQAAAGEPAFTKGVYFLGKVLWAKGYTELLARLREHATATGNNLDVDVFGSGPDLPAVQDRAQRMHLNVRFNGPRDHADTSLEDYKVFVNPSLSDVVATTTAEALAMGKWVVCARHPSNKFFEQFPNCLVYTTPDEFTECLERAISSDPVALSPKDLRKLTWEDATVRFLDMAEIDKPIHPLEAAMDNALGMVHNAMTASEPLRVAMGAGVNTRDTPLRVTDFVPTDDRGGFMDRKPQPAKAFAQQGAGLAGAAARSASAKPTAHRVQ